MTIIMRSALVAWGRNNIPPDLHSIIDDHHGRHVRTWFEVMEDRRKEQERRLHHKRFVPPWRPYRVWVATFKQQIFGGTHAFIEDFRGGDSRHWIDRDRSWLIPDLMTLIPLVLGTGGHDRGQDIGTWAQWKDEFARQFEVRRQCGEPVGTAYLWWNGHYDAPRGPVVRAPRRGR